MKHFEVVGEAILKTLEQALGEEEWEELREVWTKFYGVIAAEMQRNNNY